MHERLPTQPPANGAPTPASVQILATEHWSLLGTRSMTYNEVFSRTGIFLTTLSATVVSLALVAQATEFGDGFYVFALLVLPVVLFLGVVTFVRISDAHIEDVWLQWGMNRLRHAYLEIAPELEPYFVTGHHDDEQSLVETYGPGARVRSSRVFSSTPAVVGVIDAVVAGVLAGLVVKVVIGGSALSIVAGVVVALRGVALLVVTTSRSLARARGLLVPRFPRQD
jgi:hypothetical protein